MFRASIICLSDKGYRGEREDKSTGVIREILTSKNYEITREILIPDEFTMIKSSLVEVCDIDRVDLVITTGGTGLSPRDVTPEATLEVVEKLVPGIPEAIRAYSMTITNRAMLSRGVAGIRGGTLIINLPGSPKAVKESLEYILSPLKHGLETLTGRATECARKDKK